MLENLVRIKPSGLVIQLRHRPPIKQFATTASDGRAANTHGHTHTHLANRSLSKPKNSCVDLDSVASTPLAHPSTTNPKIYDNPPPKALLRSLSAQSKQPDKSALIDLPPR
jgi:hypothetical protein